MSAAIPSCSRRDDANEQLVVCIDRGATMIGDLPDLPLFDPAGQPTDYTKNCIQFCNDYEVECRRTESFVQLLTDLDLFETRNGHLQRRSSRTARTAEPCSRSPSTSPYPRTS